MTKKFISWLSFLAVFISFYSCRQELLTSEDQNSINKTKVEWMSKNQILQNPLLSSKLESLIKTDPKTGTGKIYTDHENGFSIDTERALMIEDEKGKKTYTFKIERSTNGALENLVLSETDNGYYDASIIKYAPELLNTKEKLTNEQVKQYITIDYLGKKSSTDIFSKIQTCYATVQQYMFVPGTTCASSDHHQYGDSSCQLTGWQAATPGYWTTSYSFIMYACDDGMPGGSIGTAPIGGGGGASDIDFDDPCTIAKPNIIKANKVLHSTAGQTMDTTLKGKANVQNEWAVALGQKPDGSYEVTNAVEQQQYSGNIPSSQLTSTYIGDGHSHSGTPGIPSGGDLYGMLEIIAGNPNYSVRFVYGFSEGSTEVYTLVLNDRAAAIAFLQQYPRSENYDPLSHGFKMNSPIWKLIDKMKTIYNQNSMVNVSGESYDRRAIGLAYALGNLSSGISVAKVDSGGNLKKINATTEQITKPNGMIDEQASVSKCP